MAAVVHARKGVIVVHIADMTPREKPVSDVLSAVVDVGSLAAAHWRPSGYIVNTDCGLQPVLVTKRSSQRQNELQDYSVLVDPSRVI